MEKVLRGLFWIGVVVGVLCLIARLTFCQTWTIPDDALLSASVAPTLSGGDLVLILTRGTPGFGDLVRCPDPEDASAWVVGRIVGVAGDIVETSGAQLSVNGKRFEGESACNPSTVTVKHPDTSSEVQLHCDVVNMGGGWHYRAYDAKAGADASGTTRREVGAGMFYLVSDDRKFHDDSRDFGPVPVASCKEKIFFRLVSKAGWGDDKARLSYIR